MITHTKFTWLHLPRTGGTATAEWLRRVQAHQRLQLEIDSCETPEKHDNLTTRFYRTGKECWPQIVAMNFRPLSEWLVSNYYWAIKAGLKVPLERYLEGEFFSLRAGRWCCADWWLDYFEVSRVTHFLRIDHLESDWRAFLEETLDISVKIELKIRNENASESTLDIQSISSMTTQTIALAKNPKWAALERRILFSRRTR